MKAMLRPLASQSHPVISVRQAKISHAWGEQIVRGLAPFGGNDLIEIPIKSAFELLNF